MKNIHFLGIIVFGLLCLVQAKAAVDGAPPAGYYSAIEGKKDSVLKSTLGQLTYARFTTMLSYGSGANKTWQGLYYTDRNEADNSVIDMYSTNKRYFDTANPTASVTNCDIEHMFPNSWWGAKAGNEHAYCDLHHLVPSDYSANRSKSNRGPGIPTDTTFNNGVWVNGTDANRDNLTVFCPPDEYKGDFARAFFYIATTYGDTAVWQKEAIPNHMSNTDWQEFLPATRDLLLVWHRNDPVSGKELKRMNEVYKIQGNRNPFIDYPCLAEYIWGTHKGEAVSLSALTCAYDDNFSGDGCMTITTPTLTSPIGTISVGTTALNTAISKTVTVRGINLTTGNLTLSLSGANAGLFSLSAASISKAQAETGKEISVTYTPTAIGNHTATLTISGCGITAQAFNIKGTCSAVYTATWIAQGTQVARTQAAEGMTPPIPDAPANCSTTRVFVGWTAQTNVSSQPADLFTDDAPALTADKTFYAVYADASEGNTNAGSEVYTFTAKNWTTGSTNWTCGQAAYGYKAGQGVQVSSSVSGANATSPETYEDIRTVVVNYCTNASSGAGEISIKAGNTTKTNSVTYSSGGTTLRNSEFDFSAAPQDGTVKITVSITGGSIYINSITINHGTPINYSDYSLLCSAGAPVSVTLTFKNDGATFASLSGTSGEIITTPSAPTACEGYTFEGWSTQEYAISNTASPTIDYTGIFPATDRTYHAVYRHTDGEGSGGASAGTTLWAENFGGFSANDIPENSNASTTVYNNGSVTYSCVTGNGSTNTTKIYANTTMYAGGSSPELLVTSKNGSFSISCIPTGNASVMTLRFKSNRAADLFSVSSGTANISIGELSKSGNTLSCDITNTGNTSFDLSITNINTGTSNARVDDFELTVKTAASGSNTTYHTTAPDCTCEATLTVQSEDEQKGTVGME